MGLERLLEESGCATAAGTGGKYWSEAYSGNLKTSRNSCRPALCPISNMLHVIALGREMPAFDNSVPTDRKLCCLGAMPKAFRVARRRPVNGVKDDVIGNIPRFGLGWCWTERIQNTWTRRAGGNKVSLPLVLLLSDQLGPGRTTRLYSPVRPGNLESCKRGRAYFE